MRKRYLPDIAPRLPKGEILKSPYVLQLDQHWIAYMGKIYGTDKP